LTISVPTRQRYNHPSSEKKPVQNSGVHARIEWFCCGSTTLPNVGKSTLFNALTKSGIAAEKYPAGWMIFNKESEENSCTTSSTLARQ
jgi:hypothetical protein